MNTRKHKHLLVLLLAALLALPALVACDDDGEDPEGDTTADTSGDTGGDTTTDTAEDTTTDTAEDTTDTAEDTAGDTTTDTLEDTAGDTGGDTTTDVDPDTTADDASITVSDQTLELTTLVMIDAAFSEGAGFVVIHEDAGGSPGPVIGVAAIPDGASADVAVGLTRPAVDGETLHAMLHVDDPADGEYTFDGANTEDLPAQNDAGEVVMAPIVVTVSAGTPDVRFTFDASSAVAYDSVVAEPELYQDQVGAIPANPGLTLQAGWRYEIVNLASAGHPLELTTPGLTAGMDVVLLSQAADGTLEADAEINWVDNVDGSFQFTIDDTLAAELGGYRCAIHASTMRGLITVEMP